MRSLLRWTFYEAWDAKKPVSRCGDTIAWYCLPKMLHTPSRARLVGLRNTVAAPVLRVQ